MDSFFHNISSLSKARRSLLPFLLVVPLRLVALPLVALPLVVLRRPRKKKRRRKKRRNPMKTWASVFLTKLDHHGLQLYEIKKKHRSTAFFFRTRMIFFYY